LNVTHLTYLLHNSIVVMIFCVVWVDAHYIWIVIQNQLRVGLYFENFLEEDYILKTWLHIVEKNLRSNVTLLIFKSNFIKSENWITIQKSLRKIFKFKMFTKWLRYVVQNWMPHSLLICWKICLSRLSYIEFLNLNFNKNSISYL